MQPSKKSALCERVRWSPRVTWSYVCREWVEAVTQLWHDGQPCLQILNLTGPWVRALASCTQDERAVCISTHLFERLQHNAQTYAEQQHATAIWLDCLESSVADTSAGHGRAILQSQGLVSPHLLSGANIMLAGWCASVVHVLW